MRFVLCHSQILKERRVTMLALGQARSIPETESLNDEIELYRIYIEWLNDILN